MQKFQKKLLQQLPFFKKIPAIERKNDEKLYYLCSINCLLSLAMLKLTSLIPASIDNFVGCYQK